MPPYPRPVLHLGDDCARRSPARHFGAVLGRATPELRGLAHARHRESPFPIRSLRWNGCGDLRADASTLHSRTHAYSSTRYPSHVGHGGAIVADADGGPDDANGVWERMERMGPDDEVPTHSGLVLSTGVLGYCVQMLGGWQNVLVVDVFDSLGHIYFL